MPWYLNNSGYATAYNAFKKIWKLAGLGTRLLPAVCLNLAFKACLYHSLDSVCLLIYVAAGTEANPTVPSSTDSGPAVCHANASLVQQGGVERCVCDPGYSGDGVNCEGKHPWYSHIISYTTSVQW